MKVGRIVAGARTGSLYILELNAVSGKPAGGRYRLEGTHEPNHGHHPLGRSVFRHAVPVNAHSPAALNPVQHP